MGASEGQFAEWVRIRVNEFRYSNVWTAMNIGGGPGAGGTTLFLEAFAMAQSKISRAFGDLRFAMTSKKEQTKMAAKKIQLSGPKGMSEEEKVELNYMTSTKVLVESLKSKGRGTLYGSLKDGLAMTYEDAVDAFRYVLPRFAPGGKGYLERKAVQAELWYEQMIGDDHDPEQRNADEIIRYLKESGNLWRIQNGANPELVDLGGGVVLIILKTRNRELVFKVGYFNLRKLVAAVHPMRQMTREMNYMVIPADLALLALAGGVAGAVKYADKKRLKQLKKGGKPARKAPTKKKHKEVPETPSWLTKKWATPFRWIVEKSNEADVAMGKAMIAQIEKTLASTTDPDKKLLLRDDIAKVAEMVETAEANIRRYRKM